MKFEWKEEWTNNFIAYSFAVGFVFICIAIGINMGLYE